MMARQAKSRPESGPRVFYLDTLPDHWIAEGTDGLMYKVPSEPGGWLRRDVYEGCRETLQPFAPKTARPRVWLVYGDIGKVTIAED